MKAFKINLHSIIDVITNSSSEIFVSCQGNTVKEFKDFITSIIRISGSDKCFDDLFDIKLEKEVVGMYDQVITELHLISKNSNMNTNITKKLKEIFDIEEYER